MATALSFARLLEELQVPYVIGGSLASTLYGEPRTTLDADFAVHLEAPRAEALVAAMEDEFFVQRSVVERAVQAHSSFHALQRSSMVKLDVYVRPRTGLFASEISRASLVRLREGPGGLARIASAEDTVLQKLRWFREGGGASERQWRDVLGILAARRGVLDDDYLNHWAARLDLQELLDRARSVADDPPR